MSTGRERDERKLARIYGKKDRAMRLLRRAHWEDVRRMKRIVRLSREYHRELEIRAARFEAALASGRTMSEIDG